MTNTLTLLRRHRWKAALAAFLLTIWTAAFLFVPPDTPVRPNPYAEASEKYVTNCDLGPACGMGDIFVLAVVIGAFVVVGMVVLQAYRG